VGERWKGEGPTVRFFFSYAQKDPRFALLTIEEDPRFHMEDPRFVLLASGEDPRAIMRFLGSAGGPTVRFGERGKKPPSLMEDPRFALLASGRTHELS
jgi:hypothetical protein